MNTNQMKMLKISVAGILMSSSLAMAQGHVGNGGGSHFCPGRSYQESYDIYEGRTRYRLKFDENQIDEQQILDNAILKIKNYNATLASEVSGWLEYMKNPDHFITNSNIKLEPIPDALILMTDEGCEYQQLANWDGVTNNIFVKASIYKQMPAFHRAALKLHEAIYKVFRDRTNAVDSVSSREVVARVLSKQALGDILIKMSDEVHKDEGDVYSIPSSPIAVKVVNEPKRINPTLELHVHLGNLDLSNRDESIKVLLDYQVSGYELLDQDIAKLDDTIIGLRTHVNGELGRADGKELEKKLLGIQEERNNLIEFRKRWTIYFKSDEKTIWNDGVLLGIKNSYHEPFQSSARFELNSISGRQYMYLLKKYSALQPLRIQLVAKVFKKQELIYSEVFSELPISSERQYLSISLVKVTQNQK